jgi:hypothetical protein
MNKNENYWETNCETHFRKRPTDGFPCDACSEFEFCLEALNCVSRPDVTGRLRYFHI